MNSFECHKITFQTLSQKAKNSIPNPELKLLYSDEPQSSSFLQVHENLQQSRVLWRHWHVETSTPLQLAHDCGSSCQYDGTLWPPKQRKHGADRLSVARILGSHRGNRAGTSDEWESNVAVNSDANICKKFVRMLCEDRGPTIRG